jgi:peptidoglycan hydrolase CwlO-like protein
MMQNVNLMMNQYPFYITNTNLVTPIFTINNNIIYNYIVNIATTITTIINSILNIFTFIFNDIIRTGTKQLIYIYNSAFGNNHDQAFIILVAFAFIVINFYDKFVSYFLYHKPLFEKITKLEQEIQWLKKNDRMRENDTENILKRCGTTAENAEQNFQQIITICEELKNIQKQMKKIDKEVKMYN